MSDVESQVTLSNYVTRKVMSLYHQKDAGSSVATAKLAQLRRGAGTDPVSHPELWGIIFGEMMIPLIFPNVIEVNTTPLLVGNMQLLTL